MSRRLDRSRLRAAAWTLLALAALANAQACPSCYGAADSPMVDGMNTAILTMVGIIAAVLGGVVVFTLMMRRRVRRMNAGAAPLPTEHNKGVLQWNSF